MLFVRLQTDWSLSTLAQDWRSLGARQWLYIGEDSTWRVQAEAVIAEAIPRLSIAERLDKMAWQLRQPYIDWIGELSLLNDSLEWWASELAAKNIYYMMFVRVCLLGVARQMLAEGLPEATLIVCSTPALVTEVAAAAREQGYDLDVSAPAPTATAEQGEDRLRQLRQHLQTLPAHARDFVRHKFQQLGLLQRPQPTAIPTHLQQPGETQTAYRRRLLTEAGYTLPTDFAGEKTILLFTWVDRRNFNPDGSYRDPHLGPLAGMLRDRGYRVAYVPRPIGSFPWHEAVERLTRCGETLVFPEMVLTEDDRQHCAERAADFKPQIPPNSQVAGVPASALALEHVEQTRFALAQALAYAPLVANLGAAGLYPQQIIHTWEGQSWEQALAWAARTYWPETRIVGADNGHFSKLELSLFPASTERDLRPCPDRIVAGGETLQRLLYEQGWPPERVRLGCTLRHGAMQKPEVVSSASSPQFSWESPYQILVATTIGLGESVDLVAKALAAFGGDPTVQLIVKCHPVTNQEMLKPYLEQHLKATANVKFVETPVPELLKTVQIVLYSYTVVCLEALHQGVVPIFVGNENFLNCDKLEAHPQARRWAIAPQELWQVVQEIVDWSPVQYSQWRSRALEALQSSLALPTPICVNAFCFES